MAKAMTPQAIAARWKESMNGAAARYKEGVQAVTTAPTHQAAQAVDRYRSGTQRAADDGSFVDGCMSVSLQEWQQKAVDKGANNLATGARLAESKVMKVMTSLMPHAKQVSEEVKAMPKGSIEDSIARVAHAVRRMAEYRKPR
jgi:predicted transcriptional regulator